MNTLTGQRTRTITGYVYTLLEYPRILIERDVDFSHCRHGGVFDPDQPECASCGSFLHFFPRTSPLERGGLGGADDGRFRGGGDDSQ